MELGLTYSKVSDSIDYLEVQDGQYSPRVTGDSVTNIVYGV